MLSPPYTIWSHRRRRIPPAAAETFKRCLRVYPGTENTNWTLQLWQSLVDSAIISQKLTVNSCNKILFYLLISTGHLRSMNSLANLTDSNSHILLPNHLLVHLKFHSVADGKLNLVTNLICTWRQEDWWTDALKLVWGIVIFHGSHITSRMLGASVVVNLNTISQVVGIT